MNQDKDLTPLEDHPTVEGEPHAVELTGIASGDKLDVLITTAVTVRRELRDRSRKIIWGLAIAGVLWALALGAAGGVLMGLRSQTNKLSDIAKTNQTNGQILVDCTTPTPTPTPEEPNPPIHECSDRSAKSAAKFRDDFRRSIDCVAFYINGERPKACQEIAGRMDRIRAGEDPFTNP